MRTKTILKSLFAMILIVPIMFIATACGASELDKEATCNTNHKYQASSMEEFDENVREKTVENETQFKKQPGYKLTYKATLTSSFDGVQMTSNITTNIIANANQMAMKAVADLDSAFANGNATIEGYFNEGEMYVHLLPTTISMASSIGTSSVNVEEQKIKVTSADIDVAIEEYGQVENFCNVKSVMDFIKANSDAVVEVSADKLAYKVTIGAATEYGMTNVVVYVNLDEDFQLTALQVTGNYAGEGTLSSQTGTATFTLCAYDGEISFPDFSEYTEGNLEMPF